MSPLEIQTDPKAEAAFANYPENVRPKMAHLRKLVLETAEETEEVTLLHETIKWGEPAFVTK